MNAAAFDQDVASLQAYQARIQNLGFNTDEQKELFGLGYDGTGLAALQSQVLQQNFNLTSSQFLSGLDALGGAEGGAIASYTNLAGVMNVVISNLTAQSSLDLGQPIAVAAGPYAGQVGAPIAFAAGGSSDPYGTSLAYNWDLNGDAIFNDAAGAATAITFQQPFSGHIGVDITNEGGNEALAYAYLTVTDTKQPPIFGAVSPINLWPIVAPGNSLVFQAGATDPDGDSVSIQWLVDGLAVAAGAAFTYQPVDSDVGMHIVEARASAGQTDVEVTTYDWPVAVVRPISLADVSVTQTDSPDPVLTGGNVTYAVTITNQGPDSAAGVILSDSLPAGASFVAATPSQGTASQSGGVVTASLGNLAAGASALVNITVSTDLSGSLSNWAAVTSSAADLNANNNTSWQPTRVNDPGTNVADLSLTLYYPTLLATVGNVFYYDVQVNNPGPDAATGGVLTETLAPGLSFSQANPPPDSVNGNVLTFNLPAIPPGDYLQFAIGAVTAGPGNVTSTATVTANEIDPNPADNILTQSTPVYVQPPQSSDLAIGQTITPDPVTISNQVTLTLTVANLGPNDATGATIVDSLPTGLTFLSATPPANAVSGQLVSFNTGAIVNGGSVTVVMQALPVAAGTLANIATVTAADTDTDETNNQSRVELVVNALPVAQSDLSISLVSSTNQVYFGSNVTITATVTNAGPDTATNTVLTGAIPAGLSVVSAGSSLGTVATNGGTFSAFIGTLTNGAGATVTIVATPTLGRPLVLVATATSVGNDPNPTNNIASISVLGWNPLATVAIAENFPDPEIDALQSYLAEMNLQSQAFNHQYGLTFEAMQSYGLIIWDDLSYAGNGINGNDVDVFNQAYNAGTRLYLIGDDLAYSADYALSGLPEFNTWVSLLHLNATEINSGGDGMMEIISTNHPVVNGLFGQVGNFIYDGDPDSTTATGTGEVVLGRSGPDDVLLAYQDPVTQNRTVTQNECAYDYVNGDTNSIAQRKILFKNAVAWLLELTNVPAADVPMADLSVTQSATPASVSVDDYLTYMISVVNGGPDVASGVVLTNVLPGNATFVAAQLSQGAWSISGNILTADLGAIVSNGVATLALQVIVGPEGVLTNLVGVLGNERDPSTNNNTAVSLLTIAPIDSPGSIPKADLSVSQTALSSLALGQLLTYRLTVTNAGPSTAANVTLSDMLPPNADFVGAETSQGAIVTSSGTVNAALGVLAGGGTATISIVVHPTAPGPYTNSALVSSDTIDPNIGNNASTWITSVTAPPPTTDLLVDVRASQASAPVGGDVTLTSPW